ncbi:MAG: PilZ domain-containing protein [Nitrospiraceae bacterium]
MDQRFCQRLPCEFPVTFSGDEIAGEGTVVDMSVGGWRVRVQSPTVVREGTYLTLRMAPPDNEPTMMEIALAVVRWSEGGEFGLEYLVIGAEARERLRRFVKSLEMAASRQ